MRAKPNVSERQMREAEELLFSGPQRLGFAKGLFFGRFQASWMTPYPELGPDQTTRLHAILAPLRDLLDHRLDPAAIDREGDIPQPVLDELGRIGVLGMTAPEEHGGRGLSQLASCRVMEALGARCASTAVFVNVHQSVGLRALLLFGTDEQKRRHLPPLARGEQLAAFALTEPDAGSDAGSVRTTATPSADGSHYRLNGEKRYITNGATAGVLTVLARTPVPATDPATDGQNTAITAFLVTPDTPGFEVVEPRMDKLGIRGTVTSRLRFHDMPVPAANILGTPGKGLKVGLTVLDFGRTTFGACCTGAAKECLRLASDHANTRRQFDRTLGEFDLVREKLARIAADTYAMEATTRVTASLIDRGLEDYMLETAMLKVFATERLWHAVDDAFQIHGGAAYFTDRPLERMLRDARINMIAEGANDVLRSFIALVGMRGPGQQLQEVFNALHRPWAGMGTFWRFGRDRLSTAVHAPAVPVRSPALRPYARRLGSLIRSFSQAVQRSLIRHGEAILERQLVQRRIADAATELYAAACTLSRWDAELQAARDRGDDRFGGNGEAITNRDNSRGDGDARRADAFPGDRAAAPELFLRSSARRVRGFLAELHDNEDDAVERAASRVLNGNRFIPGE